MVLSNHGQPVPWGIILGSWERHSVAATASSEPRTERAAAFPKHSRGVPAHRRHLAGTRRTLLTCISVRTSMSYVRKNSLGRSAICSGWESIDCKKSHFSVNCCVLNRQMEKCLLPTKVSSCLKSVLMAWAELLYRGWNQSLFKYKLSQDAGLGSGSPSACSAQWWHRQDCSECFWVSAKQL